MKKVRFTDEQMVRIMRDADNQPVAAIAKKHGVSEHHFPNFRISHVWSQVRNSRIRGNFLLKTARPHVLEVNPGDALDWDSAALGSY